MKDYSALLIQFPITIVLQNLKIVGRYDIGILWDI